MTRKYNLREVFESVDSDLTQMIEAFDMVRSLLAIRSPDFEDRVFLPPEPKFGKQSLLEFSRCLYLGMIQLYKDSALLKRDFLLIAGRIGLSHHQATDILFQIRLAPLPAVGFSQEIAHHLDLCRPFRDLWERYRDSDAKTLISGPVRGDLDLLVQAVLTYPSSLRKGLGEAEWRRLGVRGFVWILHILNDPGVEVEKRWLRLFGPLEPSESHAGEKNIQENPDLILKFPLEREVSFWLGGTVLFVSFALGFLLHYPFTGISLGLAWAALVYLANLSRLEVGFTRDHKIQIQQDGVCRILEFEDVLRIEKLIEAQGVFLRLVFKDTTLNAIEFHSSMKGFYRLLEKVQGSSLKHKIVLVS
jgi:hypothetical protein